MAVFNMMFGGMVSSDLFRVVREENSLAYSVGSSVFFDNRLLVVSAGINANDYELATDLIIKELEEYKQGKVDPDLLQVAKDNLNSSLSETADDPFSNLTFIIKNSLLKNYSSEDIIELVKQVTVEDIIRASKDVELDVIYCLKGEENGSN
jgi:predicted Zn-dependent peptidase